MKILIACDHSGVDLKNFIITNNKDIIFEDLGCYDKQSVDYSDYANELAYKMLENFDFGILICNTGIGMSIGANRHKHIRAALCYNKDAAELSRLHNDANVLCIGSKFVNYSMFQEIFDIFINTKFEGGRHIRRLSKIL